MQPNMGIPIDLYTGSSKNIKHKHANVHSLDDEQKRYLYDWFLNNSDPVTADLVVSSELDETHYGKLNSIHDGELPVSSIHNASYKQYNDIYTIVYNLRHLQICLVEKDTMETITFHPINDILKEFNTVIGNDTVVSVECDYKPNENTATLLIALRSNEILLLTYQIYNTRTSLLRCSKIMVPGENSISKMIINYFPRFLIMVDSQMGLLLHDSYNGKIFQVETKLPKRALERKNEYFFSFPQILSVNTKENKLWNINNFLHDIQQVFDLAPIIRDNESVLQILNTSLSSTCTLETTERIIQINLDISEYLDFHNVLNKNSKQTITLHSQDLTRIIFIEKNLYSISLSILHYYELTGQYIMANYYELQTHLPVDYQCIYHAEYDEEQEHITLFHSNSPSRFNTFTIA